ncbi:hypothetical protein [Burkholderia gladioli]|uniref:hypothetical protein n=1 Tax=Burkholderia gladioli TaxID=28095 RepID=UPI0016401A4F|nr:hypothetical protein [Burkholderia gladioli]
MKKLLRLVVAIMLVIPVFFFVTRIDAVPLWLYSERGFDMLAPLFRIFDVVGSEGQDSVVTGVLLALSFVISLGLVAGGHAILRFIRKRGC